MARHRLVLFAVLVAFGVSLAHSGHSQEPGTPSTSSNFEVDGDVTIDATDALVTPRTFTAQEGGGFGLQIQRRGGEETSHDQVFIDHIPYDLEIGTYPLNVPSGTDVQTNAYIWVTDPDATLGYTAFQDDVSGALEITDVTRSTVSGQFEFSANNGDQHVTVIGSFTDVSRPHAP